MLAFDETDRCKCDGYWTNLYSGLVFADKDGDSGSLYRDVYDDDKDYCKRSALHSEVMPLFCRYLELEEKERQFAKLGAGPKDPQMAAISKARSKLTVDLMHVHRLTLRGS
jgi:hypothetical protein